MDKQVVIRSADVAQALEIASLIMSRKSSKVWSGPAKLRQQS